MSLVCEEAYVIDLGNGFGKRSKGSKTIVTEPSLLATAPDFFSAGLEQDILKYHDGVGYFVGQDVLDAGLKGEAALGDEDIERYNSLEFKKMLLGFIAKDFKTNVTIKHLVTGLPVNHFKKMVSPMKEIIKGKHVVTINENQIVIEILNVHVLPQPVGTYMYLVKENIINPTQASTLIIDGGHGTLDITEMRGNTIVRRAGNEMGVRSAHREIMNYLIEEYGENSAFTLANMPQIMANGFKIERSQIHVNDDEQVLKILENHFSSIFKFIRESGFDLKTYENVVFTGGMALLHEGLINEKERANFVVVQNAQVANALGYQAFGEAVVNREKNTEKNSTVS